MPLIKSAKKALKVSIRRKAENDLTRAKMKSAVKGVRVGLLKNAKADELISKAYKELDLAAKKHVIHKNKAARLKSRLSKLVAKGITAPAVKKATSVSARPSLDGKKKKTK